VGKFFNLSLKRKILFTVCIGVTFLACVLIFLGANETKKAAYEKAVKTAESEARKTGNKVEILLKDTMRLARTIGEVTSTQKLDGVDLDRFAVLEFLRTVIVENKQLVGTYVGFEANQFDGRDKEFVNKKFHNKSGRFIPYYNRSLDGKIGYDPLGSFAGEWWDRPKKTLKETYTEPAFYKIQGTDVLMISLTYPIVHEGKFIGLSGADISLNYLQELADGLKIYDGAGKMMLFSPKGIVSGVTGQPDLINKKVIEVWPDLAKDFDMISKKKPENYNFFSDTHLKVYQKVDLGEFNDPWYIEISIPMSVINAPILSSIYLILGVGLLCTSIIMLLIWFVIDRSYGRLSEVESNLKASISITQDTSNKLKHSSNDVSESASSQASSIQQTVSTLEQINAMTTRNLEFVKSTEKIADENKQVTSKGKRVIDDMKNTMGVIETSNNNILEQVNKSVGEFEKIVEVIKEISQKTQVINGIVGQTKLLSFNASVESARAGEHGKGFAVVAQEIGVLANTSGEAAEEIGKMVNSSIETVERIVNETTDSVKVLIEDSKLKVNDGVNIASTCSQNFDEIMENITKISSTLNDITHASTEQADGVRNISDSMKQIDASVNSNLSAANEAASLSNKMLDQSDKLEGVYIGLQKELFGSDKKAA